MSHYEPLGPRARPTVVLLLTTIALDALSAVADGWQWTLLRAIDRGQHVSQGRANLSDTFVAVTTGLEFLLLVITAIFFLRWFKLAYDNVGALRASRRYRPGWAVGAWFVPILNLWRPKQIANDMWHAGTWRPVPAVINWWWGFWIVSSWIDNIVLRTSFSDPTASALTSVVSDVADAIAAVLAIAVVRLLTAHLDEEAAGRPPEPALGAAYVDEDLPEST